MRFEMSSAARVLGLLIASSTGAGMGAPGEGDALAPDLRDRRPDPEDCAPGGGSVPAASPPFFLRGAGAPPPCVAESLVSRSYVRWRSLSS